MTYSIMKNLPIDGCSIINLLKSNIHTLSVTHTKSPSALQLAVDVDGKQEWVDCADITGLKLPSGYFFGASSATGDLSGTDSSV